MQKYSQILEVNSATQGRLCLGPCARSTAEAFGARLRQTLMKEVQGAAIEAVRIDGAGHEFALLDGVVEDVVQIVENLKKVRVGLNGPGPFYAALSCSAPGAVLARDLNFNSGIRVANPAQLLTTVATGGRFVMEVEVARGVGYEPVHRLRGRRPGWIEIDRNYAPVTEVALHVEEKGEVAFVELAIKTDGTIGADEAFVEAASLLELKPDAREPIPSLCRQVAELTPVQVAVAPVARPEPQTRKICKTPPGINIPDLTELPKISYEAFVQRKCQAAERQDQGLEKLLRQAFPLQLKSGEILDYEEYGLAAPDFSPGDCRRLGRTYAGALHIHLRGTDRGARRVVEVGEFPLVTSRGTFIIAGVEKVVVGQLQATQEEGPNDLAKRRLRLVGDQLEAALAGPLAADIEKAKNRATAADFALPGFAAAVGRFFARDRFVERAETANPLALVSQLRKVVQCGCGRQPCYEARHVHSSHFGRLCIFETTEGAKIGINLNLALLARSDREGLLLTPYQRVDGGQIEYLDPAAEGENAIADLGSGSGYTARYGGKTLARVRGEIVRVGEREAEYAPAHAAQMLGASAGLIPFLAHDDSNRALMGANMQKQAVPLVNVEAPLVRTGLESRVAGDAGASLRARAAGVVQKVTAAAIVVAERGSSRERTYLLEGFSGSPLGTCLRQHPLVNEGDEVVEGQLIGDGPATAAGDLALGRNLLVGYLPWEGYNFEDALVASERLIKDDIFTSIKVQEFVATCAAEAAEPVEIDAAHLRELERAKLSPAGIVREGERVEGGDVLVARSALSQGGAERRDLSLRLSAGQSGTVAKVEYYSAAQGDSLDAGISERVRVVVALRRPLKVGDKLANRHGGKGIVGRILPQEEMPVLPDGRALDLIISPLGVPSRMNVGQLLETHTGLAAEQLNCSVVTSGFNGAAVEEVDALLDEAGLPRSGMFRLRDGRSGRLFDNESTVGYQYYMKLVHMVDDKQQARGSGEDLGGRGKPAGGWGKNRGRRLGVMETWALQAHGAAQTLQEMSTIQADGVAGAQHVYDALIHGNKLPGARVPGAVRRLCVQVLGLGLDLKFLRADGQGLDLADAEILIEDAAAVAVEFASAEKVRDASAAELVLEDPDVSFEEFFGATDGPGIKHIELVAPVQHPWRQLVGEGAPAQLKIAALPVLSPSLRRGRELDGLYLAVAAVNEAVKSAGVTAARVNELQKAVDQLMGDGRTPGGLTGMLYGKSGWFAAAMSGRAMDYSARTVIAPGCDLRYDECGLPRPMAKALFEPVVVGGLIKTGHAASADEARQMLDGEEACAMDLLEKAAAQRVVLLHRAPVLHRWGIQAFRPLLTDEDVVRLHPLTMTSFNADFDGDELDVYLPLSQQAQAEASGSMRPSTNQVGLADGSYMNPITQDMVLGCYYATLPGDEDGEARGFVTFDALATAFEQGDLRARDAVVIGRGAGARRTTVGRVLFNQLLPRECEWIDGPVGKKELSHLLMWCWQELGPPVAARLGDALMRFGFHHATLSGLSIGKDMLAQYSRYDGQLAAAWQSADEIERRAPDSGSADEDLVVHWRRVTEEMTNEALEELAGEKKGINPLHLMMKSGARSNRDQVRQLIALRGLFARPAGGIITTPSTTTFLRGHSLLECFASTYGARRGLVDTILKSTRAGFLFKRIMNAVQDVLISAEDCGSTAGIVKQALGSGEGELVGLAERIRGRTALQDVQLPGADAPLVGRGELISWAVAAEIAASEIAAVAVRSPLTCRAKSGICGSCYGADLSRWAPPMPHFPAGVIAAQSIGEP